MSVTRPKPKGFIPGEQSDPYNAICPYCGATYQVESENYGEFDREEECFECEKTYIICQTFEVTTHTRALDAAKGATK